VTQIIIRTAQTQGFRNEDGYRGIFIFDGVQTHVSQATMVLLRDNGLIVILRPPNTSSDLQGEDTVIFWFVLFMNLYSILTFFLQSIQARITKTNSHPFV